MVALVMKWTSNKKLRDNERFLVELFSKIDEQYEGLLIVVEGKRDEKILRELGVKARIVKTQSGKPRLEFLEEIASAAGEGGQVLILTDFDPEGVDLCRFIEGDLELRRIAILKRIRREIRKSMGNWRCIEEMVALFKRRDSPEPQDPR
jgi:5S rRNA maturation endonuclease (ribonuclease M5)